MPYSESTTVSDSTTVTTPPTTTALREAVHARGKAPLRDRGSWLRLTPAQALFRARAAQRLAVLAYHGVTDPRSFGAQLDRMRRLANPVSLADVERAVTEGRPLPPRSVLITFDDADRSVFTHALPMLAARGIPAAAFVIAELIGTDRPFWWHEAAHLARHGVQTETYYPTPLHLQPCFAALGHRPGDFPHAEAACERALALPLHPDLTDDDLDRVCDLVRDFHHGRQP
ncbi:DegT/DnrJ/EryC1/StrS family aminotransferase [Kitasatospora sp. NPDC007106]|uniref:polysaccharide deacetylase family protein n=1 Tax=Kitasatospora sp. NPDC007106 TaxID=3156914 RepID=UPI00340C3649